MHSNSISVHYFKIFVRIRLLSLVHAIEKNSIRKFSKRNWFYNNASESISKRQAVWARHKMVCTQLSHSFPAALEHSNGLKRAHWACEGSHSIDSSVQRMLWIFNRKVLRQRFDCKPMFEASPFNLGQTRRLPILASKSPDRWCQPKNGPCSILWRLYD